MINEPIAMRVESVLYEHSDDDAPSNIIRVMMRVGESQFWISYAQPVDDELNIVDSYWGPEDAIPARAKMMANDAISARELEITHRNSSMVFVTPAQARYSDLFAKLGLQGDDSPELDVMWKSMTHIERVVLNAWIADMRARSQED